MRFARNHEEALDNSNALASLNANKKSVQQYFLPMDTLQQERPFIFFFAGTMKSHIDDPHLQPNQWHGALRHELWTFHHQRDGYVIQDRCLRGAKKRCISQFADHRCVIIGHTIKTFYC